MHSSLQRWTARNLKTTAKIPQSVLDECQATDERNKERSKSGDRRLAVKKNVRVQVFSQVIVGWGGVGRGSMVAPPPWSRPTACYSNA